MKPISSFPFLTNNKWVGIRAGVSRWPPSEGRNGFWLDVNQPDGRRLDHCLQGPSQSLFLVIYQLKHTQKSESTRTATEQDGVNFGGS